MFSMTKEEACVTDVLIDLSEPKVSPKKHVATTRTVQISTKENQHSPKLVKQDCATGILIDFSDPDSQPLGEKNRPDDHQSVSHDYSEIPDIGNLSLSKLIDLEGRDFEVSSQPTAIDAEVNDRFKSSFSHLKEAKALSPLNAHQMAEIFEQANTIAVRIELANAKQHTCNVDTNGAVVSPSGSGGEENEQFSPEGIVTDERAIAATSTPTNRVAPDVNAHFWGAESEKSVCLELEKKASVSAEQLTAKKQIQVGERTTSMKQLLTDMSKGKTLIGRASSQRTVRTGASATSLKPKTDSLYNSRNSTASSSASDSKVLLNAPKSKVSILPPCGSTQPKHSADPKTFEVLTRSLETPSVPAGWPRMRHPITSKAESMETLAEKTKALALKPSRSLPQKQAPGRQEKKETGDDNGANLPHMPAVTKLRPKQSIPRKVGNQTTAAGKSRDQSKK